MKIKELRNDLKLYLEKHNLLKKYGKVKKLFENNPLHPSLNTEILEPKHRLIYSFRVDIKYRAIFLYINDNEIEIIAITNHYK
ncbi:hypothetical protein BGP_4712 [Beggiatoa sp. PS]|nr:hypothetical protein BGP_4712 [Beggiatoa sp. PS]